MEYSNLMVHLELGRSNARVLSVAAELAGRFHANVTGIAACQPMRIIYSEAYVPADLIDRDQREREQEIGAAEKEFRETLSPCVRHLNWRAAIRDEPLADYLSREARSADLIITGVDHNASIMDHSRHLDIGAFVMDCGRPVLIVPTGQHHAGFDRVLVGWKDSRETRRAIADAMPFLKKASHISVIEIAPEADLAAAQARVDDVARWLNGHGITAEAAARAAAGEDAHQLHALTLELKADLIVAGAYGHSRVREWVMGGVTRDLLLRAGRCALVSH